MNNAEYPVPRSGSLSEPPPLPQPPLPDPSRRARSGPRCPNQTRAPAAPGTAVAWADDRRTQWPADGRLRRGGRLLVGDSRR